MDGQLSFDDLISMQQTLIDAVPHAVREDCLSKMVITKTTISSLMLYINSCGRKPWRASPLSDDKQDEYFRNIQSCINNLHSAKLATEESSIQVDTPTIRRFTSCLGIIEETLEFIDNKDSDNELEELADILFFYLEAVIGSKFTVQQILDRYVTKHAENMARYASLAKGDTSWDLRAAKDRL